jgi:hypothetical protein
LAGLLQKHFGLSSLPLRINGSVSGPKRQEIVDSFELNRHKFDVMILSPKAGGVGLTITSANHVIHLSRWWNPAVEDQATDRVFRIGQTRDVHVYLPMAVHPDPDIRPSSFDLRLDALIERKRTLTRDLFLPPEPSDGELSELFREVSLGTEPSQTEVEANANSEAAPTISTDEPIFAASAKSERPLLTLPKAVVTSGIRRWRCEAGQPRPTHEILQIFSGKRIALIAIRDPYALATQQSREAQVLFLKALSETCAGIGAVIVEYAPDLPDSYQRLDDAAMRRAFNTEFLAAFKEATPKISLNRRIKKSRDDDFHDRFVEIDVDGPANTRRRHEITIGRGLEALFDEKKQCTVTYAPPSA